MTFETRDCKGESSRVTGDISVDYVTYMLRKYYSCFFLFQKGSVLTQQTVLGFSSHPPSPFGAASLPHCITEQRGGQQSFAMSRHTQLQFNLGIPPHQSNLATHFDPSRPSPVMIEKPSFAPDPNGREFRTISAKKLALAVRLAKRDLRVGRFQSPAPSASQSCLICRDEQSVPPSTVCCGGRSVCIQEPQTPTQADVSCTDMSKEGVRDPEEPLPQRTPQQYSSKNSISESKMALLLVDEEGNKRRREDQSSQEVLRLRKELQRQVAYIKQLRELGRGLGHVTSTQRGRNNKRGQRSVRGVESGRVWMEEVMGEEEKLLQREEEQAARNARTIYNLSHQLSRLQQDMQKLQLNGPSDSKKKVWRPMRGGGWGAHGTLAELNSQFLWRDNVVLLLLNIVDCLLEWSHSQAGYHIQSCTTTSSELPISWPHPSAPPTRAGSTTATVITAIPPLWGGRGQI